MGRQTPLIALTVWTLAFGTVIGVEKTRGNPDSGSSSSQTHFQESPRDNDEVISNLTVDDVDAAVRAAFPTASVRQGDRFQYSGQTDRRWYVYGDPSTVGDSSLYKYASITAVYYGDGSTTLVSCDTEAVVPDADPVLALCLGLQYAGSHPSSVRTWALGFFNSATNGSSLRQTRSEVSWRLSVDRYGQRQDYGVSMQSAIGPNVD